MGTARPPRIAWSFTSADTGLFVPIWRFVCNGHLLIARLAAGGVKRRSGASMRALFHRKPLDDFVVCVRADDGRCDLRRAVAVGPPRAAAKRWQRGNRL